MPVKETILLLGGTGFIGSNILNYILNEQSDNYKIVILSRGIEREIVSQRNIEFVSGDYADNKILAHLFSKWNFTKVIHCASSTIPLSSGNNFLDDINGNLIATIGLLEVMKENGCNYILYLSSGGAVYGETNLNSIPEIQICNPVSSYGVVKLTIENYLRLYQKQYGINYLILRVSNPFGKFHYSEKQGVINIAIRRALNHEMLDVWGDGSQSKDYIYVDDLVKIIFLLIERGIVNLTVNVGSGKKYQLNQIVEIIKVFLPELEIRYRDSKVTDVKDFCLDISFLQSLIKFEPTSIEKAIVETIKFERGDI
jgi:UDP-glucose 4-epimerase